MNDKLSSIKTNSDDRRDISDDELAEAFVTAKNVTEKSRGTPRKGINKLFITLIIIGSASLVAGVALLLYALLIPPDEIVQIDYPDFAKPTADELVYSDLTGEVLSDATLKNAPVFCIQTPNGTDGARPQAGLDQAGVVFEAIAESGITRFAAIYQNPTAATIGPIRSLRIYYLEWDTPFDCTIVHAGGSDDALAAVAHGYRDLTENYNYMFRGTNGARLWNNLFTSATDLKRFNTDYGYNSSDVKGFARMTPAQSNTSRIDSLAAEKLVITKPTTADTSQLNPAVSNISFRLGGWSDFNVNYQYDVATNKYLRFYESGAAHQIYSCPEGETVSRNPEDYCTLTQMSPSVVIAMVVAERKAWDGYHEDIDAIGSGDAYIFQNGTAIRGTWKKSSRTEQIQFIDESGQEIRLAPGQTFVTAVPQYGSIAF